jgi:putative addiction module component (TIGR02574 family)
MSKSEILNEGDGWLDAADLTDEERQVIESRLEAHRQNPDAAIPWVDVEAKLVARFGQ